MADMDDLEARLREFRPRRPADIPDQRLQRLRGPLWVAAVGGLAAAMFIASRLHGPAPLVQRPSLTLGALTAIGIDRPDELDAALTELSRTSLPDVTRPGGALQRLSTF